MTKIASFREVSAIRYMRYLYGDIYIYDSEQINGETVVSFVSEE